MEKIQEITQNPAFLLVAIGLIIAAVVIFTRGKASRLIKYDVNTTIAIMLVFGILVVINAIPAKFPTVTVGGHRIPLSGRKDLTQNQRHSITADTINLLRDLKQDVNVTVFFSPLGSPQEMAADDILNEYQFYSNNHFKYHVVNPITDPVTAQRYKELMRVMNNGRLSIQSGTLVMDVGDKHSTTQIPANSQKTGEVEEKITRALLEALNTEKKTVYFVKGHGEKTPDDPDAHIGSWREQLTQSMYDVKTVNIAQGGIPADASVLIVCSPDKDFQKEEIDALRGYVEKGGGLMVLADPPYSLPTLEAYLGSYGVTLGKDLVYDPKEQNPVIVAVDDYSALNPITAGLKAESIFAQTRSVSIGVPPTTIHPDILVKTPDTAWAVQGISGAFPTKIKLDPSKDKKGPIILGVAVTGNPPDEKPKPEPSASPSPKVVRPEFRIAVYGTSTYLQGNLYLLAGDADLAMRSVNWLAMRDKGGTSFTVATKVPKAGKPLELTEEQMGRVRWLSMILIPGVIAMAGIIVFMLFKPN